MFAVFCAFENFNPRKTVIILNSKLILWWLMATTWFSLSIPRNESIIE